VLRCLTAYFILRYKFKNLSLNANFRLFRNYNSEQGHDFFRSTFFLNTRRLTVQSYFLIAVIGLLVLSTITYGSPNHINLYAKSHNDKGENNDSGKTVASNTADSNNENLQMKDNADTPHDETQVPTHPIVATRPITSSPSMMSVPIGKNCATNLSERPNPVEYLTYFNCGHVTKLQNGTTLREFSLVVSENNVLPITDNKTDPVLYNAWTFNNTIPGPTMRMTQGDLVKITVYNSKSSLHPHSLHMHSIHSGMMDGVTGMAGTIPPGGHYTYTFTATPYGVYPYHCHVAPVQSHINHGLYGAMIIDPKVPRPPAREMVMLMNGYNLKDDYSTNASATEQQPPTASALRTNFEKATASDEGSGPGNQIYSVNGPAFIYNDYPIQLATGQQYRIYLVNMLEFDPMNNFHLHGNMFEYYPAGTGLNPTYKTDIVELAQGDRGIIEFNYTKPGMYMFHAHTTEFTNLGWMGMFNVVNHPDTMTQSVATISSTPVKSHQTIKLHHNQDSPMNINRPPFVPGI
jgi:hypothetical protein